MHCVIQDLQTLRLLEDWVKFVPRSEIENLAATQLPQAATAKPLAWLPTLLENDKVRRRDMEGFIIHLGLRNREFRR